MIEKSRKRVLFISGARADFGKLKSLIRKVEEDPDFDCALFATGMHHLKKYGNTIREIEKEKLSDVFQFMNQTEETSSLMDVVLANTIQGLSNYISENPVDMIVVHGDRVESLAGAIVGALKGVRTAHIEGGERSGTVDELIRHAVTKLSHIHFTATEENRERLLQMGEDERNIFVIGSPDIDIMLSGGLPSWESVLESYEIPFKDYYIFIYHPVVTETESMPVHAREVFEGLKKSGRNFVVIYPNNDKGSNIILSEIKALGDHPNFRCFPSIRFEKFLVLLKNAKGIIGNSSCGIHEAPIYGIPTVNIGSRQRNRFKTPSIFNVPEDKELICKAILELPERMAPVFTYGRGNSAERFLQILKGSMVWEAPLQKKFYDRHYGPGLKCAG